MAERSKPTFKKADLRRAIEAFQDAALPIGGARITPDGAIEVLTVSASKAPTKKDALAEWEAKYGQSAA